MWMTDDLAYVLMQAGSGGSGGAGGADSNGNHDITGALESSHSAIFGGSGGGGSGGGFGGSFGSAPMENGNTSAPAAVCSSDLSWSLLSGLAHGWHVWWLGAHFQLLIRNFLMFFVLASTFVCCLFLWRVLWMNCVCMHSMLMIRHALRPARVCKTHQVEPS